MGSTYNKRIFGGCVARRICEILQERGEDQLDPRYLAHLQDKLWGEYRGEVDAALADGYKWQRIDGVVRRHRTAIVELLDREKTAFYKVVERRVERLIAKLDIDPDSELTSRLVDEMWGMVGYQCKRGHKPSQLRRLAKDACRELLEADLVYQHRDDLAELRRVGDDNVTDLPEPEFIDDAVMGTFEEVVGDLQEIEEDVIVIIQPAAPCRCGAGVLSSFERSEGGEEVALARKGRPQSLSYTRLSEGDYLGVNAQIVSQL